MNEHIRVIREIGLRAYFVRWIQYFPIWFSARWRAINPWRCKHKNYHRIGQCGSQPVIKCDACGMETIQFGADPLPYPKGAKLKKSLLDKSAENIDIACRNITIAIWIVVAAIAIWVVHLAILLLQKYMGG